MTVALELVDEQDIVFIQAAAPALMTARGKLRRRRLRSRAESRLTLTLVENPDVAATIGQKKKASQVFVGFAAETNDVIEHAQGKLMSKNLDMIVARVTLTRPGARL